MPKTKFQDFVYTIIMIVIMVYAMVCYNVSINIGGMSNKIFFIALKELPIMVLIAFILEFFLVGNLSKKITFKLLDPKKDNQVLITILISSIIVAIMCPLMSFIGSLLFNYNGISNLIANYFQAWVISFPMALCFQLFYAGPLVRWIFKKIFRNN